MSLVFLDFVPTIAFLIGAYYLVRITIMLRGTPCGRMAMAGAVLVFLGGFLKATWKLLYVTQVGDYQWMSQVQFVLLAPGFFALLVAIILMARKTRSVAPFLTIVPWKIPLLAIMTLSSMGSQGILTYMAFQRKNIPAAIGFITAFLCLVAMGAMTSSEQTLSQQWIEEGTNVIGELGFMVGAILLHRDYKIKGCN
jgi:hypothetical protein